MEDAKWSHIYAYDHKHAHMETKLSPHCGINNFSSLTHATQTHPFCHLPQKVNFHQSIIQPIHSYLHYTFGLTKHTPWNYHFQNNFVPRPHQANLFLCVKLEFYSYPKKKKKKSYKPIIPHSLIIAFFSLFREIVSSP